MNPTPNTIQTLVDSLSALPDVTVRVDGPTVGDYWFIDVTNGANSVVVEALPLQVENGLAVPTNYKFGFSLLEDEPDYGMGPDVSCSHIPTLIRYVGILLQSKR